MLLAMKETHFAKRLTRRMLSSHSKVSARHPALSGKALYREILLHTQLVDPSHIDQTLSWAEDGAAEWGAHAKDGLGFRQVVLYVVTSKYRAEGHEGTVVSFRDIVYSLIPAGL
jgi:hypothetical protein